MAILPYPFQLPQDFYAKNYVPPVVTPTPGPPSPPIIEGNPPPPAVTVNNGGIYYGPNPPASPSYGWLWTAGNGYLYVYIEPGVWQQVTTNW